MKNLYIITLALAMMAQTAVAQENLKRHVIAVPQSASTAGNLISWRMLDTDDEFTTFDVMKNGKVVKSNINSSTNYLDTGGGKATRYQIITKHYGEPVDTSDVIAPWQNVFAELKLDRPAGGTFHDSSYTYSPNDCSVADVDGDGLFEIVVKWEPSNPADNSQGGFTGPTIFDCYKIIESEGLLTAQKLWRIDMGHNIRSGPHYVPFLFYDFDGDGKAEFIVKTGPGTLDGAGKYVSEAADEDVIRAVDNEKEYLNGGGQVMFGPEFLTVFNGQTGAAIHTVYYNPNRGCFVGGAPEGRFDIWGDDYGNRSERYLATAARLDASQPHKASAVMCRGYYTRSYLWAVDFDGKKLSTRWRHASLSRHTAMKTDGENNKDVRWHEKATYEESPIATAYGQGNHNLTVGDVDGDGMDEIIYGSAAIDHDGNLLWSTGLSHGDAIHMSDLMPDRPGLEVFQIHEDPPYGMHICDAATGELLIHKKGGGDTARGMAADVNSSKRGYEFWYFGDGNMYNAESNSIVGGGMSYNFRVYWDGDVYDELIADIGNHNQPFLEKYNAGRVPIDGKNLYEYGYNVSCNGTKGSPNLVADIFGDWREEMIFFNNEDKETLNIFSSSTFSVARVPCLMYDHIYRMAITWQNSGYNQPPHLGYYLPDVVAPHFDIEEKTVNEAGDSVRVVGRYVNCTGVSLEKVIFPDGTTKSASAAKFKLTKDLVNCKATANGKVTENGTWKLVFKFTGPSNSIAQNDTVAIEVGNLDGIEAIENEKMRNGENENVMYDLSGRRLANGKWKIDNGQLPKGIYIKNGKKFVNK